MTKSQAPGVRFHWDLAGAASGAGQLNERDPERARGELGSLQHAGPAADLGVPSCNLILPWDRGAVAHSTATFRAGMSARSN